MGEDDDSGERPRAESCGFYFLGILSKYGFLYIRVSPIKGKASEANSPCTALSQGSQVER